IFSLFWQRICNAGFEEIVVPIRASTDTAAEILKERVFDLVFIDGDHRYDQTLKDVRNYSPLVKPDGGILCGHDCEGYLSDFDPEFLNQGKDEDCQETVHCGVVLVVGFTFEIYSINHSIWSVIHNAERGAWQRTDLQFPDLEDKKQAPPSLLGTSDNYQIFRYGKRIFAVPKTIEDFDVTDEKRPLPDSVITTGLLGEAEQLIGERIWIPEDSPILLSAYKKFNLVRYKEIIYALHESIGPLDLTQTTAQEIRQFEESGQCLLGDDVMQVKEKIDSSIPILVEENYRKFNIVFYREKYFAVAQDLGKIKDWAHFDIEKYQDASKCFVGDSHISVLRLVDQLNLQKLEEEKERTKSKFRKLQEEIKGKESRIAVLEKQVEENNRALDAQTKDIQT
ncbi:MAG: class I SAM-dependent methyltransferase, partial [Nitrospinae bacterium]|nr:class I SAM-dependent methyltransferase [Nitrospinota bacterium]